MLRAHGRFTRRATPRQRLRHIRNAHPKQLGYLTNPLAIVPRREHPLAQILRISPASLAQHPRLRFYTQPETQESQINPVSEDPF